MSILKSDFEKQEAGKADRLDDHEPKEVEMEKLQKDVDSFAQSFPLSKEAIISQNLTKNLVMDFESKHDGIRISSKERAEFAKIADGIVNKLGADSIESNFDLVKNSTIKTIEKSKTFTSRVLHALGISPNTVEKLVDKTVGTVEKPLISNLTNVYKKSHVKNAAAMAKKDVRNLGMVKVNEELGRVKDSKAMAKQVVENLGVVSVKHGEKGSRVIKGDAAQKKEAVGKKPLNPERTFM